MAAKNVSVRFGPAALLGAALIGAAGPALGEVPYLREKVTAGALPAMELRLPDPPGRADFSRTGKATGKYGGKLRMLRGRSKDTRHVVVFGYARLVGYSESYEFVEDLAEKLDIEDSRVFTFTLRRGHRWSDGTPFTSEDFRFYWEDIANNRELSPLGPPRTMLVDGKPPEITYPDARTVRIAWEKPNPFFLPRLAGAAPLFIYRPAHYLRQFHPRYADPEKLAAVVSEASLRNWAALFTRHDRQYRFDNPDMPTLQPWVPTQVPPAKQFIFSRNPYYHRVDPVGNQLPYIDELSVEIVNTSLIPAKTGTGDTDLQARNIRFDNYTFLKQGEAENGYDVRLWPTAKGAHFALYPNMNAVDETWQKLFRDVRFRRALSLAINRREINQVVYFGLAQESGNAPLPGSKLAKPAYTKAWTEFDVARANALLDEMGLERGADGLRRLPDGRPAEIVVETAGESTEQTDVLALIKDSWAMIGIGLFSKPSQREVLRNRIFSGQALMSVWSGFENGVPTANMSPQELAPTDQHQLMWPQWGQFHQTGGKAGSPPDMDLPKKLLALNTAWQAAATAEARETIWHEMLSIYTDQVYSIGVIAGVLQPVVVNRRLRNVPEKATYNWDPGAFFGIYRPDTFWFEKPPE